MIRTSIFPLLLRLNCPQNQFCLRLFGWLLETHKKIIRKVSMACWYVTSNFYKPATDISISGNRLIVREMDRNWTPICCQQSDDDASNNYCCCCCCCCYFVITNKCERAHDGVWDDICEHLETTQKHEGCLQLEEIPHSDCSS